MSDDWLRAIWIVALSAAWGLGAMAQGDAASDGAFVYEPKGRRDPFVPLVRDGRLLGRPRDPGALTGLQPILYGILWDRDGKSIALINDQEVNVGDAVGSFQVEQILPDSVVLIREGGESVVLELAFEAEDSEDVSAP